MNKLVFYLLLLALAACKTSNTSDFIISKTSTNAAIFVSNDAPELVKWAANDLAQDLTEILERKITIDYIDAFQTEKAGIYIGKFDDKLIADLPENYNDQLKNEWEKFILKKQGDNLFIVGSDIRGTVYGIFDVAERMGISPWKWWADVHPERKESVRLNLPKKGIEESPSVQYRGIFLNDEDWGLQPWAAKTFEPETGDIGPKTYEKIFQLLLRLKANTIWPAMHPCTKAFFSIPDNRAMAEKYHISIGTSHAEPMLRNNVDEWDKAEYGDFNYFTNSEKVKEYWSERIAEARNGDNIISLGMRGIHDSGMEGNATREEKVTQLEKIIDEQRQILREYMDNPVEDIPQVFTLYKEVLDLYNAGLKIPDDVTLMWTDDNYGYIRRLSDESEQQRKGGSGVYYHLSYWGRPHDYLWLSTTQPGLIWYEMTRAYQNGAQKIWIANVGDIKPAEYDMEFFLDLAWDINSITESTIKQHLLDWSSREFGREKAGELANIFEEYYRLAFLRKPEYMGWSQTEPTTPTQMSEFMPEGAERRIEAYTKLVQKVEAIKPSISKERADAFFQLVEYPVKGAALMNRKFLFAQQSFLANNKAEKEKLANKAQNAYDEIVALTHVYNQTISDGKWQNMMSMEPRNLPVFHMPGYHLTDKHPDENTQKQEPQETAPIFINGSDYSTARGAENYQWKAIEDLGYSNSGMTLFPFENHIFREEKPYLEYSFQIEKAGTYQLEVRCLPTHSNNFDHKLWIQVDDVSMKEFNLNTKGRSEEWKENVLRNFVPVRYSMHIENTGKQTFRIFVNHPGIVIDQIAIVAESNKAFYEIVK